MRFYRADILLEPHKIFYNFSLFPATTITNSRPKVLSSIATTLCYIILTMAAVIPREFILSALRSGFGEAQIAEALNVTVGAVEQVINAYGLREMAAKNSKFENIDSKINNLEDKVLDRLEKSLGFVTKPMELTRMLQVLNSCKRRSLAEGKNIPQDGAKLIQLNLPERMELAVTVNARNEVIGVNGRTMTTIKPARVLEHLKETEASDEIRHLGKTVAQLPGF